MSLKVGDFLLKTPFSFEATQYYRIKALFDEYVVVQKMTVPYAGSFIVLSISDILRGYDRADNYKQELLNSKEKELIGREKYISDLKEEIKKLKGE